MKLIEALEWRYAVKKMNGNKIPADKLNTIIDATRLAPSAFGLTPYTIIVVEDEETRKKLQPHFYNQPQVGESSALVIFATWNSITEKEVSEYMQEIAEQRGVPVESLNDFAGYINGSLKNLTPEQARVWADKQTYLALGFGLVAAAAEQVDATPMEGFNAKKLDELLGLAEQNLKSVLLCPIGFRSSEDNYQHLAKVRKSKETLFQTL